MASRRGFAPACELRVEGGGGDYWIRRWSATANSQDVEQQAIAAPRPGLNSKTGLVCGCRSALLFPPEPCILGGRISQPLSASCSSMEGVLERCNGRVWHSIGILEVNLEAMEVLGVVWEVWMGLGSESGGTSLLAMAEEVAPGTAWK